MQVFRFHLTDYDLLLHTLAVDRLDAILDICEQYKCQEQDIHDLERVEKLSSRLKR